MERNTSHKAALPWMHFTGSQRTQKHHILVGNVRGREASKQFNRSQNYSYLGTLSPCFQNRAGDFPLGLFTVGVEVGVSFRLNQRWLQRRQDGRNCPITITHYAQKQLGKERDYLAYINWVKEHWGKPSQEPGGSSWCKAHGRGLLAGLLGLTSYST